MKNWLWLWLIGAPIVCAQDNVITETVEINATQAEVFQTWTTSAGVKTFFAPDARVELRVDGPYEIYFNPLAEPGMKGADGMRIIGYQENRMLSFTWNAPPHLPEARRQRTHVTVRLTAQGENKTLVSLSHAGWGEGGEWDKAHAYFAKAWKNVLGNLKKRYETGPIDWSEWLEQLKKYQESQKR